MCQENVQGHSLISHWGDLGDSWKGGVCSEEAHVQFYVIILVSPWKESIWAQVVWPEEARILLLTGGGRADVCLLWGRGGSHPLECLELGLPELCSKSVGSLPCCVAIISGNAAATLGGLPGLAQLTTQIWDHDPESF
jgi:hypothetical protein